jgi:DNA-binding FadR family transcriptional regulator
MELGMAESIFQRKTAKALKELRALAGSRRKHPTMEEEIAFHSKLVSIGGNVMGGEFLKILTSAFTYIFEQGKGKHVTPFHADLCDALEGKSAPFFCKVMKAHFEPYMN